MVFGGEHELVITCFCLLPCPFFPIVFWFQAVFPDFMMHAGISPLPISLTVL